MESKTAVMEEPGQIHVRDVKLDELGANEVLVRVELTGICGTDVHMNEGGMALDYPVVPGHEFAGIIEEIGEDVETDSAGDSIEKGDGVTVVPGISCNDCWYCNNLPTRPLACNDRKVYGFRNVDQRPYVHGGLSEYFVIEEDAVFYRLPDVMPVDLGALVEPTSVATHALERAYTPGIPHAREGFGIGKSIAVQGAGPVGLLTMAGASAAGAGQIIAIDLIDDRLALARKFGATDIVNPGEYDDEEEYIRAVHDLASGGVGPDVVVEAVGHPDAVRQGIELPRNAGTFVEVGHYAYAGEAEINPTRIVQKELNVYGSLAYPPSQFETAISMLSDMREEIPFTDLFNYEVGFNDIEGAYEAQKSGEAYRATIRP